MTFSQNLYFIASAAQTTDFWWVALWLTALLASIRCCAAVGNRIVHGVSLARAPRYYSGGESFWSQVNNMARYCKLLPDITEGSAFLVLAALTSSVAWTIAAEIVPSKLPFGQWLIGPSWIVLMLSGGVYLINRSTAWVLYRQELRAATRKVRQLWQEDHEPLSPKEAAAIAQFATNAEAVQLLTGIGDDLLAGAMAGVSDAILQAESDRQTLAMREKEFKLTGG